MMTDKEIIALYFKRSENAIEQTDEKYGRLCHSISINILNDFDTSVCIRNEEVSPVTPQHIDNAMVYYPVREERGNHNHPFFRLIYNLNPIFTGGISFIAQVPVQAIQILQNVLIELGYFGTLSFALLCLILRPYEVGAFIYQVINILNFLSLGNEYLSCITDI